jgi:hypothetical protein
MNIFSRSIYRIGVCLRELGERKRIYWLIRLGVHLSGGVW